MQAHFISIFAIIPFFCFKIDRLETLSFCGIQLHLGQCAVEPVMAVFVHLEPANFDQVIQLVYSLQNIHIVLYHYHAKGH
jgi:hypothetical protein